MKKILNGVCILSVLFFYGCGNSEMAKDAQKIAELKCKAESSFNKVLALNNEMQKMTQEGIASGDMNVISQTMQKQQEILKKLEPLQAEGNKLGNELSVLQKEIEKKYPSDDDKKAFALELTKHLGECK